MLHWNVWNGTVFAGQTEMFEIELLFDIETAYLC